MNNNNGPTTVSLFSGAGGLDMGFVNCGFNLVWANEIDKDAVETHKKYFDTDIILDNITNVINKIPSADVLVGGPPCQSFSMVGKRIENDDRGKLVMSFFEAVKNTRPKVFVMENVSGITSSRINGKRLHLFLAEKFSELGYIVEVLKLDATNFFVPQRRNRVFLIGRLVKPIIGDLEDIAIHFVEKNLIGNSFSKPVSAFDALDDLPDAVTEKDSQIATYKSEPHSIYARLMREKAPGSITLHEIITMSELDRLFVKHIPPGGNYTNIPDDISTKRIMKFKQTGGRTTTYGRLHPAKPAYTINTYFNRPNVGANYHYNYDRLITAREALRLQSFPDWFQPCYRSKRSLYAQIGNAVPPFLAFGIAGIVANILGYSPNE